MLKEKFIDWMKNSRKLLPRTVKEYSNYLDKLELIGELNKSNADEFFESNNNNVARSFMRTYIKFLSKNPELIGESNLLRIKLIDVPEPKSKAKKEIEILTKAEIEQIVDSFKMESHKVMLLITYYGGLRAFELMNVKYRDFNWLDWSKNPEGNGILTVPHGKGDKKGKVRIPGFLMERVAKWCDDTYPLEALQSQIQRLFPISYNKWWRLVTNCGKIVNQDKKFNPHIFRHSLCSHMIEAGIDISIVKEQMRHEDISSTQLYTHLSENKLDESYSKFLGKIV